MRGVQEQYLAKFCASGRAADTACGCLAGGLTNDAWNLDPFPVCFTRARGPYKWSVEGYRLIDFWMGHGALLCGHSFDPVMRAIRAAVEKGLHFGGPHPKQIEWAQRICSLVPSAERVRFTNSGTEATLLAFRIARAYTGKRLITRFDGHFHGWHDEALVHSTDTTLSGLSPSCAHDVVVAESESSFSLSEDAAAVILEPGGGGAGALPWSREILQSLKRTCHERGTVLIFDETLSGFRYHPGGVQALTGVHPDLTILGKIVCGGLPGGVVAGGAKIMDSVWPRSKGRQGSKLIHSGTFNGSPISAAAGVAILDNVADGSHQRVACKMAEQLVDEVNDYAAAARIDIRLFQGGSIFHTLIGAIREEYPVGPSSAAFLLPKKYSESYGTLRKALLIEGVDAHPVHGWVSSSHTPAIISQAAAAYRRAFGRLIEEDFSL
jgi:glutamate-1-semialdehyde 2,1-aminomutase